MVFIEPRPKFWRYKAEAEGRADTKWTGICPACAPVVAAEHAAFLKRTARRYNPVAEPKGKMDITPAAEGDEPKGQLDLGEERDEYWK